MVGDNGNDGIISGFALYNVCTEDGVCMYRRQDFKIEVPSTE